MSDMSNQNEQPEGIKKDEDLDAETIWFEESIDFDALSKQKRLTGVQAAMALAGFDPFKTPGGIEGLSTKNISAKDYTRLCSEFENMEPQPLAGWLAYARETCLRYRSELDVLLPPAPKEAATMEKPVPKLEAQERAILAVLKERGVDPYNIPVHKGGTPGVKADVWDTLKSEKQLFQSPNTFKHAWDRVRANHRRNH